MNCESISAKYFIGSKPRKFSPAKLSSFTVYCTMYRDILHTFFTIIQWLHQYTNSLCMCTPQPKDPPVYLFWCLFLEPVRCSQVFRHSLNGSTVLALDGGLSGWKSLHDWLMRSAFDLVTFCVI